MEKPNFSHLHDFHFPDRILVPIPNNDNTIKYEDVSIQERLEEIAERVKETEMRAIILSLETIYLDATSFCDNERIGKIMAAVYELHGRLALHLNQQRKDQ